MNKTNTEFDFKYDTHNYIDIINSKSSIIKKGVTAAQNHSFKNDVDKIIIMGMGGSGLAGRLIKQYLKEVNNNIRVEVVNDYNTKEKIDSKTAVFVCSYSGNTEEALYFFDEHSKFSKELMVITSGGELLKEAKMKRNSRIIRLEEGLPPRVASTSMFFSILKVLENSNIIENHTKTIKETISFFENKKNRETIMNYAKKLALRIKDKTPLIYTTKRLESIGYFWKISFNENSEVHSFHNTFPELSHNELNAFNHNKGFYVILLIDKEDPKVLKEKASALKEVFLNSNIETTATMLGGNSLIERYLNGIYLAELTSYFLAILLKKNPKDITMIEKFKEKMNKKRFFYE